MKMDQECWAGHVEAVKLAGITTSEYARRHGISVDALYYWQRKLTNTGKQKPSATNSTSDKLSKFVALQVRAEKQASPACVLEFSTNVRMELLTVPSVEWLVAFAQAIQGGANASRL